MSWYSRLNLKAKFIVVTCIVVIAICACLYFFIERFFRGYLQSEMQEQAGEIAGSLQDEIANFMGPDAVQGTAEHYLTERREISRIVVYRRIGNYFQPFVKAQTQEFPPITDLYSTAVDKRSPFRYEFQHQNGEYWEFAYPILTDNRVTGLTTVTLNFSQYKSLISAVRTGTLLILVVGLIAMLVSINIYAEMAIRRPLAEIVNGMQEVKRSHFDVQLKPHSQDEIGMVAADFNRMTRALGDAQEEIMRQNKMLEKRVREATSELRSRNLELFTAQDELRRVNRLATAGQVAAMLAHELGSPLSSISGHLQLMLENSAVESDQHRRLHLLLTQVERLSDTIGNFLRSVTGLETHASDCDLNSLLEHMIQLTSPVMIERKIEPQTELDQRMPLIVADSNQLQQLFLNLFTNSMDAMAEGGCLRVSSQYAPLGSSAYETHRIGHNDSYNMTGLAVVTVTDTGEGMEPESLKNLFKPFFSSKEFGRGTGLGLTICREIVKAHGGQIKVQSEPDKGTCFTIVLPIGTLVSQEVPSEEPAVTQARSI